MQTQLKEAQDAMKKALEDQAQQKALPLVNQQPKGTRLDGSQSGQNNQNNENALGDPRRYDQTHMMGVIPVMQSFSNPFIQAEHAKEAKLAMIQLSNLWKKSYLTIKPQPLKKPSNSSNATKTKYSHLPITYNISSLKPTRHLKPKACLSMTSGKPSQHYNITAKTNSVSSSCANLSRSMSLIY